MISTGNIQYLRQVKRASKSKSLHSLLISTNSPASEGQNWSIENWSIFSFQKSNASDYEVRVWWSDNGRGKLIKDQPSREQTILTSFPSSLDRILRTLYSIFPSTSRGESRVVFKKSVRNIGLSTYKLLPERCSSVLLSGLFLLVQEFHALEGHL